jgi:hypothetical protein
MAQALQSIDRRRGKTTMALFDIKKLVVTAGFGIVIFAAANVDARDHC